MYIILEHFKFIITNVHKTKNKTSKKEYELNKTKNGKMSGKSTTNQKREREIKLCKHI
jgi:hypothetical protein